MARPVELAKSSRFVVFASVCVVIAGLYLAQEVLVPLALAVLFAFLLTPIVAFLQRHHLGRSIAVVLVVALALGAVGGLGWVVKVQLTDVIEKLPTYREDIQKRARSLSRVGFLHRAQADIKELTQAVTPETAPSTQPGGATGSASNASSSASARPQPTPDNPVPVREYPPSESALKMAYEYLGRILTPLATAGLVIIFTIFMLLSREDMRDRMIRLLGHGRLNITTQAVDEAGRRISKFLVAQAVVNLAYGVCTSVGLWVIGLTLARSKGGFPNVVLWGLLAAVLRFVPYVGIWIAAGLPVLLSFALGNAVFGATLALFVVFETVVSQFIEPMWYGASTGMSPVAILVSAVFWTWLWGPIGLVLSTPLTVCLVVVGKYVPQLQFLDILLGDEPVLEPPVRIYQRLLALDQEEALELAQEYLKTKPLEEVYDDILVPALVLAEQDWHSGQLDEERHKFVHQSLRELIEELGDAQTAAVAKAGAAATVEAAKAGSQPLDVPAARPHLPKGCVVNIACLPARDEADEIVGLMLSQLLELRGFCAFPASATALAAEMVTFVEERKADLVCVSALPPGAVAHARYLCKKLHARFPDIRMTIGLWTLKGEARRAKAKERITCVETVRLAVSLNEALHEMEQMAAPVVTESAAAAAS